MLDERALYLSRRQDTIRCHMGIQLTLGHFPKIQMCLPDRSSMSLSVCSEVNIIVVLSHLARFNHLKVELAEPSLELQISNSRFQRTSAKLSAGNFSLSMQQGSRVHW